MSLYGPTFHVTRVDLCIMFQCNLYISCIMSCGNKIVSNCFLCWAKFLEDLLLQENIHLGLFAGVADFHNTLLCSIVCSLFYPVEPFCWFISWCKLSILNIFEMSVRQLILEVLTSHIASFIIIGRIFSITELRNFSVISEISKFVFLFMWALLTGCEFVKLWKSVLV